MAAYALSQPLGRQGGSTAQERGRAMPGDSLVSRPTMLTNHAVTINAPSDLVWPW
jgi:hypothetical protein